MPYYHMRVVRIGKRPSLIYEFDLSKKKLEAFFEQARKGGSLYLPKSFEWINERELEDIDIAKTPKKSSFYGIGRLKGKRIFDEGKIVTSQFIKKPLPRKAEEKSAPKAKPTHEVLSKNVFIVHGKDKNSVEELKSMLGRFGLKPIVLHEQPSGSRTIIEKLERYGGDIGYAFVILTPDDFGGLAFSELKTKEALRMYDLEMEILNYAIRRLDEAQRRGQLFKEEHKRMVQRYLQRKEKVMDGRIDIMHTPSSRARQNVILEFGYFMGLLGRDRVCCLYKGDVELPSDMHGIVYLPFKESINECRNKIIKELKAVGYEIKM